MSARGLREHPATRSVLQAKAPKPGTDVRDALDEAAVARRLAATSARHMPWLGKTADLTPPDGGPEVCGPAVYRGAKR